MPNLFVGISATPLEYVR